MRASIRQQPIELVGELALGAIAARRKALPDQQRIADHMRRAGHQYEAVSTIEAVVAVLVACGVVRPDVQ